MTRKPTLPSSLPLASLAAVLLAGALSGCAPLLMGGAAVGTALVVTDRRTSGTQVDDQTIELRSAARLNEALGDRAHINVSAYNRQVLMTGEVATDALRQQAEQIVSRVDNVRSVVNELAVMPSSSLVQRSNDAFISGKVRASFVDASDLQANVFTVVTERGTVYLMGRVSPREADRATSIARQISGVQRVVRVFEVMTPEETRAAGLAPGGTVTPATVAPATTPAPAAGAEPAPQPADSGGAVTTPVR